MECVAKANIFRFGIVPMKTGTSIKERSGGITKYEIVSGYI